MGIKRNVCVWGLSLVLMLGSSLAFASVPLQRIKSLYQQGQLKQAYALAVQYLPEAEGEPEFDFLYGQIAIDNGKVAQGVFALERVLLMQPGNQLARLELARGYFLLGQQEKAKAEFDKVLAVNPPQAVKDKIDRYLKAVRYKQSEYKTSTFGYAQFTLGYDTNINTATGDQTFSTPTLGTGTLTEDSLSKEAAFGEVSFGGQVTHPLARGKYLFAGLDLSQKVNDTTDNYDLGTVDVRIGTSMVEGDKRYRLSASAQHLELGYSSYLDLANLTAQTQYKLSSKLDLNGYLRVGALSYDNLDNRDAYTAGAGLGATVYTDWRFKPSISGMVFLGKEDPMESNATSKELADKESIGLALSSRMKIDQRSFFDVSLLWQNTQHQAQDSVFLVKREDDYYKLGIGYTREISKDWKMKLEASHSRLDSNIAIYEYDRTQVSGSLRYEF